MTSGLFSFILNIGSLECPHSCPTRRVFSRSRASSWSSPENSARSAGRTRMLSLRALAASTAGDITAKTTMLVVGDEGFGPTSREKSHKLQRAEGLNAQPGCRIQILSEADFCSLAGVPSPDALKRQYQAMRDLLARYDAVREDHLRYLMKCGVIQPVLQTNADLFFSFADVAAVKQLNDELAHGASFHASQLPASAGGVAAGSAGVRFSSRCRTGTGAHAAASGKARRGPRRRPAGRRREDGDGRRVFPQSVAARRRGRVDAGEGGADSVSPGV